MPWQAAAISAGSKLLGGLLGGDKGPSLRQQRNNMKKTEHQRFKWLVKGAQNAGFNPLSVLRATGGAMAPQLQPQTPLNARAVLGEAIADFGGTFAQDAIQRATEERAQEDWKERQDYQRKHPLSRVSSNTRRSEESEEKDDGFLKEGEKPYAGQDMPALDHRVQVRLPTGNTVWVLKHVLDRYNLNEGEMLTAGDMTEMQGELTGEAAVALQFDEVLENLFRQGIITNVNKGGENFDPPIKTSKRAGRKSGY